VRRYRYRWLFGGVLLVLLVTGGVGWRMWQQAHAATPAPTPRAYRIGGVTDCRTQPAFTLRMGYSQKAVLSSRERTEKGLILYEPDANGNPTRPYQDPSWMLAGSLSPPVTDRAGNIYVAPVPNINMLDNPVDKANIVYRVDTQSGVMAAFATLPAAAAASPENPYGILGLTYDCDTNSLYASSVFGSTRTQVAGRIFRIDLATGQIASRLDAVDAFGIAIYNTAHGKRLLFGLARTAAVQSVALDAAGNFTAAVRDELSLAGLGVHGDERARRLQVEPQGDLVIRITQFSFNLTAPVDPRQTALQYHYDRVRDAWQFVSATPLS
jgi:hypothetical protein